MAGALKTSLQSLEAGASSRLCIPTGGGGDAWLEHAGDRVAAAAAAVAEGQPAAGAAKPSVDASEGPGRSRRCSGSGDRLLHWLLRWSSWGACTRLPLPPASF